MIIESIPTAYPAGNCWLCYDEASRYAVLVDPPRQADDVDAVLKAQDLRLQLILLTHGHFDHIFGVDALRDRYGVPAAIHEADADMLVDPVKNASMLFFGERHIYRPADRLLRDGDEIAVGASTIRVMHTPGHSPGSVCYCMGRDYITGDTLFRESIGRTDLPGGDWETMRHTLDRFGDWSDRIRIYPGHGESSGMAHEKKYNPYLQRRI